MRSRSYARKMHCSLLSPNKTAYPTKYTQIEHTHFYQKDKKTHTVRDKKYSVLLGTFSITFKKRFVKKKGKIIKWYVGESFCGKEKNKTDEFKKNKKSHKFYDKNTWQMGDFIVQYRMSSIFTLHQEQRNGFHERD